MTSSDALTVLFGIAAIAEGFYIYWITRQVRAPVWAALTIPSDADRTSATSLVLISNRGTTNITENDVLRRKPLSIVPDESTQLSRAEIYYRDSEGDFKLQSIAPDNDPSRGWKVIFENIEAKDFVIFEVKHTGSRPFVSGSFRGARRLRQVRDQEVDRFLGRARRGFRTAQAGPGAKDTVLPRGTSALHG